MKQLLLFSMFFGALALGSESFGQCTPNQDYINTAGSPSGGALSPNAFYVYPGMSFEQVVTVLAPSEASTGLPFPSTVGVNWIELTDLQGKPTWLDFDCGGQFDPAKPCRMSSSTWACVRLFSNTTDGTIPDTVSYPQTIQLDVIVDANVTIIGTQSGHNGGSVALNVMPPMVHTVQVNDACYGATGSASVSTTGGFEVFNYDWQGYDPNALNPGTYQVIVQEVSVGWLDTVEVVVGSVAGTPIEANVTLVQDEEMGQSNGSITVEGAGGVPPYEYLWSNGETNASVSGLTSGDYTLSITDSQGCSKDTTITVNEINTAGLSDLAPFSSSVYPNPAGNYINISLKGSSVEEVNIQLIDLTGRVMVENQISGFVLESNVQLDLSTIESSMYILKITSGNYTNSKTIVKK